jgi:hypothetical protein
VCIEVVGTSRYTLMYIVVVGCTGVVVVVVRRWCWW